MKPVEAWMLFACVQFVCLAALLLGLIVLPIPCLLRAWIVCPSPLNPARTIDRWTFTPLNWIYGNPEDGVSGACALIWITGTNGVGEQVPYMPGANASWRAFCWSALRNSCDQLKYRFAWSAGPFYMRTIGGFVVMLGWHPNTGFPTLSATRKP